MTLGTEFAGTEFASEVLPLRAEGLTRRFGRFTALRSVSVSLRQNEIHGLIGPNGAGKTTLLRLLGGQDQPERGGEIWLSGQRVTHRAAWKRARLGLGRSFQRARLFTDMTIADNLVLAIRGRSFARGGNYTSGGAQIRQAAERAMAEVSLAERGNELVRNLSHGERRLVELAMAFAGTADSESRVVLLDEPLAGLGAGETVQATEVIRRNKNGRAVLMIEHDLDAVFELADRITVLIAGEAVVEGTREEVLRDPRVRAAYLPAGGADR